jgi:hypothetical protein
LNNEIDQWISVDGNSHRTYLQQTNIASIAGQSGTRFGFSFEIPEWLLWINPMTTCMMLGFAFSQSAREAYFDVRDTTTYDVDAALKKGVTTASDGTFDLIGEKASAALSHGNYGVIGGLLGSASTHVFGAAGDTVGGLIKGESLEKAALSGISSTAIKGGLKYAIPVVGKVLLVSAVVQASGNIQAAKLAISGNEVAAGRLQKTLDYIDLGGYVDGIGDNIADFILDPGVRQETIINTSNWFKKTRKFSCGFEMTTQLNGAAVF